MRFLFAVAVGVLAYLAVAVAAAVAYVLFAGDSRTKYLIGNVAGVLAGVAAAAAIVWFSRARH